MFDKNDFKEKFRCWSEMNVDATLDEAKSFCDILIPFEYKESYSWLEEQSLAWFIWKKDMKEKQLVNLANSEHEIESFETDRNIM
ncbi:hypothetical protein GCL60_05495 [Silvanigrella paludirubra]|uniref:Uncharacterized protein n=1 Tax=Silvanigrella paludirubra TaxID=2499159 RepID=A0A6N6VY48_9BACT|nr:hypothetical protein [Silvanigrella paludirubra]KAB8039716.1 hypothetical protein GCL60_05495 [Silvanigrella paludirubra]